MILRPLIIAVLVALPLAVSAHEEGGVEVIDVSGPLDAGALRFIDESIHRAAASHQELAVVMIDSPAVLDGLALDTLLSTIAAPPLPLAVWVGPAPARAHGGAALIVAAASERAISPGSSIGLVEPVVVGDRDHRVSTVQVPPSWVESAVPAEKSGLRLEPTIRQYVQALDGQTMDTVGGPVVVGTLEPSGDGVTLRTSTFREPGLGLRSLRLAILPEAAFFFLAVGLAVATFEFFAIGPGVAAAVSALSLILGGWGVANLPVRPWALALTVLGWLLLTAAYQRGGVLFLTLAGAVALQVAGTWHVDGAGQIDPRWYLVLPTVLAVLFFFLLAMPTVQRARFSTRTIGREGLIGLSGTAMVDFDPEGTVEVNGARWKATAHREAGLRAGSPVVVVGVDGLYLEVEPGPNREN